MTDQDSMHLLNNALRQRKLYVTKLIKNEINFEQLVQLAQLPENKSLLNLEVGRVLARMSGWSKNSVLYAMTSHNIPLNTKIKNCAKSEYLLTICSSLFSSSATTWHRRLKAPDNWPWGKSMIEYIVAQYDNDNLPRSLKEINNSSRFVLDEETLQDVSSVNPLEDIFNEEEEVSNIKQSVDTGNNDINLYEFFGESFTEDEDDSSDLASILNGEPDNDEDDGGEIDADLLDLLGE